MRGVRHCEFRTGLRPVPLDETGDATSAGPNVIHVVQPDRGLVYCWRPVGQAFGPLAS